MLDLDPSPGDAAMNIEFLVSLALGTSPIWNIKNDFSNN